MTGPQLFCTLRARCPFSVPTDRLQGRNALDRPSVRRALLPRACSHCQCEHARPRGSHGPTTSRRRSLAGPLLPLFLLRGGLRSCPVRSRPRARVFEISLEPVRPAQHPFQQHFAIVVVGPAPRSHGPRQGQQPDPDRAEPDRPEHRPEVRHGITAGRRSRFANVVAIACARQIVRACASYQVVVSTWPGHQHAPIGASIRGDRQPQVQPTCSHWR